MKNKRIRVRKNQYICNNEAKPLPQVKTEHYCQADSEKEENKK